MPATIFNSPQHRKRFEQRYGTELTAILLDFNKRLTALELANAEESCSGCCPYSSFVPPLNGTTSAVGLWCKKQEGRPECVFAKEYENCYVYKMNHMLEEAEENK